MPASAPPLLAKLTRPRFHDVLPRERLFDLLDGARERGGAICVVGPPGAGKTTLVATWLEDRGLVGPWFQVDPGDTDLATFSRPVNTVWSICCPIRTRKKMFRKGCRFGGKLMGDRLHPLTIQGLDRGMHARWT